jgi:hypothetical protein
VNLPLLPAETANDAYGGQNSPPETSLGLNLRSHSISTFNRYDRRISTSTFNRYDRRIYSTVGPYASSATRCRVGSAVAFNQWIDVQYVYRVVTITGRDPYRYTAVRLLPVLPGTRSTTVVAS